MKLKVFILSTLLFLCSAFPVFALDATKAVDVVILAHQAVTHPDSVIGTTISVADDLYVCGAFYYAPVENADPTLGSIFRLQYSTSATGNEDWITFPGCDFLTFDTVAADESLNSTEPAGETAINVTDADTGWTVGQTIYVQDAGAVGAGEFNYVEAKDTTPVEYIHLVYGLTGGKDSSDTVWGAEIFPFCVDVTSVTRIRAYFSNQNTATGVNAHIKGLATKFTDIL